MILTLDPATKCGWAMMADDDSIRSGVWDLSTDDGQEQGWQFVHLKQKLARLEGVELVAFEKMTATRFGMAADVMSGLVAIIITWCIEKRIPFITVAPNTLKKFMTGHGRAEKKAMCAAAAARFPDQIIQTSDQGDALCVLAWVIEKEARRVIDAAKEMA